MRILLRDTNTRQYLLDNHQWTSNPNLALDFQRTERALRSARSLGLHHFELIVDLGIEPMTSAVPAVSIPRR